MAYTTQHKYGRSSDLDDTEGTEEDVERLSSAKKVVDNVLKLEKTAGKA